MNILAVVAIFIFLILIAVIGPTVFIEKFRIDAPDDT